MSNVNKQEFDFTDEFLTFNSQMKKDYTILVPNMLPWHFDILCHIMKLEGYNTVICGNEDDPLSQEQALFSSLRKLDDQQASRAFALLPPDKDAFRAVRNRLLKAGGFQVIHL